MPNRFRDKTFKEERIEDLIDKLIKVLKIEMDRDLTTIEEDNLIKFVEDLDI